MADPIEYVTGRDVIVCILLLAALAGLVIGGALAWVLSVF